jgi:hypothetical protein
MKKPCLAPFHPFKQTWFEYHGYPNESENYCSSCHFYYKMAIQVITAVLMEPRETLYGGQLIYLTREDAHTLIDAAYDAKERR